jgi:Capsular polysaccharide synthesis protein
MTSVPRVIYSAWLQGVAQAPAIVQLCFTRWARLNPEYQLRVLDASDAAALLAGHNLPAVPAQAFTDILRVKLLLEHGGIWADATVLPVAPLRDWLPGLMPDSGIFAFSRPGPDRPIASWFMAAAPGHVIVQKLWDEIRHFWRKPRRMAQYNGGLIPPSPSASVAPGSGGATDEYPYFWLHYLFQYLLETDAVFASVWALCPQISAEPPHRLQNVCAGPVTAQVMEAAAKAAPVQKLNWRASYRLDVLARL